MYSRDVPLIADWARDCPENMRDLCTFVLLTIRVGFDRVADQFKEVKREGEEARALWGWKPEGYRYLRDHAEELYADLFDAGTVGVIETMAGRVPGFGLAKGAFVAQLLGHDVACLDVRNITDLGIPIRTFREVKSLSPENREKHIRRYCRYSDSIGGAEKWWNHWCTGIAPSLGLSPEKVSRLHYTIPRGKRV